MGGPQDQDQDRGGKAGRVQDPPGCFPQRGGMRGVQRLAVDLVTEPDVPGQQPVGHLEGAQLPGRGGRRGQREQILAQPPPVGQVVAGPLFYPRCLPVGPGGRDGEQRDHDQRRPEQGEQNGRADERDAREDHAQGLGRRTRQRPAALAQRLDLGQVLGPLEVLKERRRTGQGAEPQAEAQVGQVGHLGVERGPEQLQHPAGRDGDGRDDQANDDQAGLMAGGPVHDGAETER
jgi:hypothetical protein